MTDPVLPKMGLEERAALLGQAVGREVAQGYRVESQTQLNAVLVRGRRINHLLHLILTLVTVGFWAIVWIIMAIVGGEKRISLQVDDYGQVLRS